MAVIFQSFFMKTEFEELYKVLIPNLNECGNCGITKCCIYKKFDASCILCRHDRCKACVKFINSTELLYERSTKEQWDYICNFIHIFFAFTGLPEIVLKTLANRYILQ